MSILILLLSPLIGTMLVSLLWNPLLNFWPERHITYLAFKNFIDKWRDMSGGTYCLQWTPNEKLFDRLSMVKFKKSAMRPKKYFSLLNLKSGSRNSCAKLRHRHNYDTGIIQYNTKTKYVQGNCDYLKHSLLHFLNNVNLHNQSWIINK